MKNLATTILLMIAILAEVKAQDAPFGVNTIFNHEVKIEGGNFNGTAWVARLFAADDFANSSVVNVTFKQGSRSNWHSHPAGQILFGLEGTGYYQERGGEVQVFRKGDVFRCPPNVEHWHGASHDSWFVQLAITTEHADGRVQWLEPVTDEEYEAGKKLLQPESPLTNLSHRQKHIVMIASLTARGELDKLKVATVAALDAGLTINEIKEVLVHLYAYCGFPRSIQGLRTFLEMVEARKAEGITDQVGKSASPIDQSEEKYERGKAVLGELTGMPQVPATSGYRAFSPEMDIFLMEHLFADIFERDVLSYQDRELTTLSALINLGGVDPMINGHMRIAMNIGIPVEQLQDLLTLVEVNFGEDQAQAGKRILSELSDQ